MVELRGIGKFFPASGVQALEQVDFDLRAGEIHALMGENGAGKSTLMRILAGFCAPGAGAIRVDGAACRIEGPQDALRLGIGMVDQHPQTIPGFSVLDYCLLGAEGGFFSQRYRPRARQRLEQLVAEGGFNLDLDADSGTLSVNQRQKAALLALLYRDARVLILDEVTAVLAPGETESLFALLRTLREQGRAIVLISHKVEETLTVADRASVLRRGRMAGVVDLSGHSAGQNDDLAQQIRDLMFGPGLRASCEDRSEQVPPPDYQSPPALELRSVCASGQGRVPVHSIDLTVWPGEIVGVAGVRESGLDTLELLASGLLAPDSGVVRVQGVELKPPNGARGFRLSGGACVSAERRLRASASRLSVEDNLGVHLAARRGGGVWDALGLLPPQLLRSHAERLIAAARVRCAPGQMAGSLSGGSLQRLIIERELAEQPRLLILSDVFWGMDAESRLALETRLLELRARGVALLLLSTDLDSLLRLATRVLVLHGGRVNGEFPDLRQGDAEQQRQEICAAMIN